MDTDLTIINAENLKQKAYITFYFEGVRQRIYSGRAIGLMIFPNRAKTVKVRVKRLEAIKRAVLELVETNSYPYLPENESREVAKIIALLQTLKQKDGRSNKLSEQQKQKLRLLNQALTEFLDNMESPAS